MLNQIVDKYGQHGQHKFVQSWFYQQYNLTIYANKLMQSASEHLQQLGRNNKLVKFMYEDCVKTNSDREIYQPGSPRLV
jgi:hypothetical protein